MDLEQKLHKKPSRFFNLIAAIGVFFAGCSESPPQTVSCLLSDSVILKSIRGTHNMLLHPPAGKVIMSVYQSYDLSTGSIDFCPTTTSLSDPNQALKIEFEDFTLVARFTPLDKREHIGGFLMNGNDTEDNFGFFTDQLDLQKPHELAFSWKDYRFTQISFDNQELMEK